MRYWIYIVPIILFAGLALLFYRGLGFDPRYIPSPLIGKKAPQYSLPRLKDPAQMVGSDDYRGQVALVNVWAYWCPECRREHSTLIEISKSNIVPIYGIDWNDDRADALNMLATLGDPYVATGFDGDGSVGIDWGVYGAPETFLVDRDGTVLYKQIGPMNAAIWEKEFMPLIVERCGSLPCPRVSVSENDLQGARTEP